MATRRFVNETQLLMETPAEYRGEHDCHGIFFEVKARDVVPILKISLRSICVFVNSIARGQNFKVYTSETVENCRYVERWEEIEVVADEDVPTIAKLELQRPIEILPGRRIAIFVHASRSLCYAKERSTVSYRSDFAEIFAGVGYFSKHFVQNRVLQQLRPLREFVGSLEATISRIIVHPDMDTDLWELFPARFRRSVALLFLTFEPDIASKIISMMTLQWFDEEETRSRENINKGTGVTATYLPRLNNRYYHEQTINFRNGSSLTRIRRDTNHFNRILTGQIGTF